MDDLIGLLFVVMLTAVMVSFALAAFVVLCVAAVVLGLLMGPGYVLLRRRERRAENSNPSRVSDRSG